MGLLNFTDKGYENDYLIKMCGTRKGLKTLASVKASKVYIVYKNHLSKITIIPTKPNCNNLSCFKTEQMLGRCYRKA